MSGEKFFRSKVIGVGGYLPDKVVTNDELSKTVETSDEWIKERTGIQERRIADESETTSSLGIQAAKNAIKNAGISSQDIDLIILATATPDNTFPATATLIQSAWPGKRKLEDRIEGIRKDLRQKEKLPVRRFLSRRFFFSHDSGFGGS